MHVFSTIWALLYTTCRQWWHFRSMYTSVVPCRIGLVSPNANPSANIYVSSLNTCGNKWMTILVDYIRESSYSAHNYRNTCIFHVDLSTNFISGTNLVYIITLTHERHLSTRSGMTGFPLVVFVTKSNVYHHKIFLQKPCCVCVYTKRATIRVNAMSNNQQHHFIHIRGDTLLLINSHWVAAIKISLSDSYLNIP
jgi:hypothetical protein